MKWLICMLAIMALGLSGCLNTDAVTAAPNPFLITPSRSPLIYTVTPLIIYPTVSETPSATATLAVETPAASTPAFTETLTPTFTLAPETLGITLLGCEAGFDVTHGMGEVTNVYVKLTNSFGPDLEAVCATLAAADEGRVHPDKTICVDSLPLGYQTILKLTVDTAFQVSSVVEVTVSSSNGLFLRAGGMACTDIGAFLPASETLGVVEPIQ
ncbi:MAG: hypothetical protein HY867_03600 [Chloroflexi bacterium]|nr:hypothetical protein [Chloroflexota bacterium]